MKTTANKKILTAALILSSAMVFTACNKEEEVTRGQLEMRITDSPSDDAEVEGVFMTIASVTIDGKPLESFKKQTIEVSAYTEGNSAVMFDDEVEIGQYSKVELTLDHMSDARGDKPGCYAQTRDGKRHSLRSNGQASETIQLQSPFEVRQAGSSIVIIDADLRKCVTREEQETPDDRYEFVSNAEMNSGFRFHDINSTGSVTGEVNLGSHGAYDHLVVYAYKKGRYTQSESEVDGSTRLRYRNCSTSTRVNANGEYVLAFLEEGEYEIIACGYNINSEGEATFEGELALELLLNGSLTNTVTVGARSQTTLNIKLL